MGPCLDTGATLRSGSIGGSEQQFGSSRLFDASSSCTTATTCKTT
jgi:hypothetical protein